MPPWPGWIPVGGGGPDLSDIQGVINDSLGWVKQRSEEIKALADAISKAPKTLAGTLATVAGVLTSADEIDPAEKAREVANGLNEVNPQTITEVLVGFAQDPFTFIWNVIFIRLIQLISWVVLTLGSVVIDATLFLFVGDDTALETSGQLGLSDLVYVLATALAQPAVMLIDLYTDTVIDVALLTTPQTGTVWSGVLTNSVIAVELFVSVVVGYRLLIAILDAIPVVSGVQTFISGGS